MCATYPSRRKSRQNEKQWKKPPKQSARLWLKKEAAKEKSRKKAEEKKRIEDEKNRLIWPFLVQFVDDIKSGARKIGSKHSMKCR